MTRGRGQARKRGHRTSPFLTWTSEALSIAWLADPKAPPPSQRWDALGPAGARQAVARALRLTLAAFASAVDRERKLWREKHPDRWVAEVLVEELTRRSLLPLAERLGLLPRERAELRREVLFGCADLLPRCDDLAEEAIPDVFESRFGRLWPVAHALAGLEPRRSGENPSLALDRRLEALGLSPRVRELLGSSGLFEESFRRFFLRELGESTEGHELAKGAPAPARELEEVLDGNRREVLAALESGTGSAEAADSSAPQELLAALTDFERRGAWRHGLAQRLTPSLRREEGVKPLVEGLEDSLSVALGELAERLAELAANRATEEKAVRRRARLLRSRLKRRLEDAPGRLGDESAWIWRWGSMPRELYRYQTFLGESDGVDRWVVAERSSGRIAVLEIRRYPVEDESMEDLARFLAEALRREDPSREGPPKSFGVSVDEMEAFVEIPAPDDLQVVVESYMDQAYNEDEPITTIVKPNELWDLFRLQSARDPFRLSVGRTAEPVSLQAIRLLKETILSNSIQGLLDESKNPNRLERGGRLFDPSFHDRQLNSYPLGIGAEKEVVKAEPAPTNRTEELEEPSISPPSGAKPASSRRRTVDPPFLRPILMMDIRFLPLRPSRQCRESEEYRYYQAICQSYEVREDGTGRCHQMNFEESVKFSGFSLAAAPIGSLEERRQIGTELFEALFVKRIRDELRSLSSRAEQRECPLFLRLRCDDESKWVACLPWELLYDPSRRGFMALTSPQILLTRYPQLQRPELQWDAADLLQVLLVVPAPKEQQEARRRGLWDELERLAVTTGRLHPELLPGADYSRLAEASQVRRRDVVHILGRCEHDGEQHLVCFQAQDGSTQEVRLDQLESIRGIRLLVLDAPTPGPRGELGFSLGKANIPAVLVVGGSLPDNAATTFFRVFYGGISGGLGIAQALDNARRVIRVWGGWYAPSLYLRTEGPDLSLVRWNSRAS